MGRGRAKAKQQKVARELKYSSHQTDLDALQRELGRSPSSYATDTVDVGDDGDDDSDGDSDDDRDDFDAEDWTESGR